MIANRFLSRPQWESKLRKAGAIPLEGAGPLNTAEWWRVPGKSPFTVPIEDDQSCEFWALQRICRLQTGKHLWW